MWTHMQKYGAGTEPDIFQGHGASTLRGICFPESSSVPFTVWPLFVPACQSIRHLQYFLKRGLIVKEQSGIMFEWNSMILLKENMKGKIRRKKRDNTWPSSLPKKSEATIFKVFDWFWPTDGLERWGTVKPCRRYLHYHLCDLRSAYSWQFKIWENTSLCQQLTKITGYSFLNMNLPVSSHPLLKKQLRKLSDDLMSCLNFRQ